MRSCSASEGRYYGAPTTRCDGLLVTSSVCRRGRTPPETVDLRREDGRWEPDDGNPHDPLPEPSRLRRRPPSSLERGWNLDLPPRTRITSLFPSQGPSEHVDKWVEVSGGIVTEDGRLSSWVVVDGLKHGPWLVVFGHSGRRECFRVVHQFFGGRPTTQDARLSYSDLTVTGWLKFQPFQTPEGVHTCKHILKFLIGTSRKTTTTTYCLHVHY